MTGRSARAAHAPRRHHERVRDAEPTRRRARRWVAALVLAACSSGSWAWRRPDGSDDPDRLQEDIEACELYAQIAEMNHHEIAWRTARPYGGWGSFPFEFCMHQHGWALRQLRSG